MSQHFRTSNFIFPDLNSQHTFIGAVEIGTFKTTTLVGEYTGRELAIIGRGECPSRGVIKGSIADFKAASDGTQAAIEQAERDAGERIDCVFLAQSGGHLDGFYNEAAVNVKAADNMIGKDDIQMVCDLARAKELPPERMVVQHIRRPYRVDGRLVPTSPENLVGQKLEVGYWTVHGQEQRLADFIHVIRGCNLEVRELVLSSLASGHMVTTAEERQNGILAVDIGAGTTDYVLYRDGVPHTTGVVPIGGGHLTNDLSIGLRLTEGQAEKLKLRFGRAIVQTRDRAERVWLDGNFAIGDRQFPRLAIEQITAARTWELLDVVKKRLGPSFSAESCAAGIVLTGGTAKLPAITECAAKVFGTPAHLGEAPSWVAENLRDPGFHTALGLLYYGVSAQADNAARGRRRGGFLRGVTRLFAHS
jgi:cell division protein FtsA